MADFTLSQIQDRNLGAPAPTQGVAEPSAAGAALSFVGDALNTFAQGAPARAAQRQAEAEAERESYESTAAGRFSRQQLQIAEAVDRGELTSQEGRMRMRANFSAAIANDPSLTETLTDTHKAIVGTAGLGKVADEGTEIEQQFMQAQNAAMQAGWISDRMTPEQARQNTYAFLEVQREKDRMEFRKAQLALESARVGLSTARINNSTAGLTNQNARLSLQQKQNEVKAEQALKELVAPITTKTLNDLQVIQRDVESGDMSREDGLAMIDSLQMQIQSDVSQLGAGGRVGQVEALANPILNIVNTYRGHVSGETQAADLESAINAEIQREAMQYVSNGRNAEYIGISKMIPQSQFFLASQLNSSITEYLGRNSREGAPANLFEADETDSIKDYLGFVGGAMDRINAGDEVEDGTLQETSAHINQILKGLGSYASMVDNPGDMNTVVNFLASDRYGLFASSQGTGIQEQNRRQAADALTIYYDDVVVPLLKSEWDNAKVTTSTVGESPILGTAGETVAAKEAIEPIVTADGVSFAAKAGMGSNPRVMAKVRELNSRVGEPLNRLLKAASHLNRSTNYGEVFTSRYEHIFGSDEEGEGNDE